MVSGFWRKILGDPDQATVRAGFSVAYERQGLGVFTGQYGENPGSTLSLTRDINTGIVGPGETCLEDNEVLTHVTIPAEAVRRKTAFRKLKLWQGDFAVASAAVSVAIDSGGRVADARVNYKNILLAAISPGIFRSGASLFPARRLAAFACAAYNVKPRGRSFLGHLPAAVA